MALGFSLKNRAAVEGGLGALALVLACLTACRRSEQKLPEASSERAALGPSTGSSPSKAPQPAAAPAEAVAPAAPSTGASAPAASPDPRTEFLVGTQGESVSLRSLGGQTRTLVPGLSSWLYDPSHGLLWFLDEDRLGVADLRGQAAPTQLAKGIPEVGSLWVEWPPSSAAQFVRVETGCEEDSNALELKLGAKPSLRMVEPNRRRSLSKDGLRWLQEQQKRVESTPPRVESFDPGARRVALPKGWSGCEDAQRCGLSAAFGASALRLVLVRDDLGADCFHLGCLLYDPAADRFSSPPVLVDEGGMPSLATQPPRWTSAAEATPGSCGPYRFDESGTALLAHRYLCKLDAASSTIHCDDLAADGIGWLRPGAIAGRPG